MNAAGEVIPGDVVGRPPPLLEDSYASILLSDCTCNITIVARRDALEEAGPFDESLRVHEDWDMWLRVTRSRPMIHNDRLLARFRWHEGNTTAPSGPYFRELVETRERVLDKQFRDPTLPPKYRALEGRAYSEMHLEMGVRLWANGHRRAGLRRYAKSVACADGKAKALLSAYGEGTDTRDAIWRSLDELANRQDGMAHWEVDAPEFMGGGRAAFTGLFHGAAGIGLAILRMQAALSDRLPYVSLPDDPFAWSR